MAVVSRIAKLRIQSSADASIFRQWTATAAVQDTAAGQSVNVQVAQTTGGATPPAQATTLEFRFYDDAGTRIRTVTLDPATTGDTIQFRFTTDGASTGAARCGTVEIAIYVKRVDAGVTVYEVETDGAPNNAGTGNASVLDRGWIRGTTTLVEDLSNVGILQPPAEPAAYDDSLYVRATSGADSYVARALSVAVSNTTPALSTATSSTTAAARDVTFANVCDNRFPAALTAAVGVTVTVPNAALTGEADWAYTAVTDDTIQLDPRLTVAHLLQINDNTFGTPPTAKDTTPKQRLAADLGFAGFRVTQARGAGVNGLTVTEALRDAGNLANAISRSVATQAQGGQDGWAASLMTWDSQLPSGAWTHTVTPATADATGLGLGTTQTWTLLANDPRLIGVVAGGPKDSKDRHAVPGKDFQAAIAVVNVAIGKRVALDAGGAKVALLRLQDSGANAGYLEYLDAAGTWVALDGDTDAAHFFDASESRPGSRIYAREWTAAETSSWGTHDVFVVGRATVGSVTYGVSAKELVVGAVNNHDGYSLDPIALALHGVLATR